MRGRFAIPCIAITLLAICALAADQSPDELLKSKQLTKVGAYYLLDVDAKLPQSLRAIRQADAELATYSKRRHYLDDEVERTQSSQIRWGSELQEIQNRLSQNPDPKTNNDLVFQANQRITAIKQAEQYIDQCHKDLAHLQTPPDSLNLTIDLAQRMQAAATQYDLLAADDAVKAALEQLNQSPGIKFRLGPSPQFKTELPILRRENDKLTAAPIKLEFAGGVPHVQAMLNGSLSKSMVFDSGAGEVVLTSAVATEIGLHPSPNDPQITTIDANGRRTLCRVAKLATLRVGPFTIGDVECVILPAGEDADCLLGGTFLHNFLYRMDLGTGQLFLTPVAGAAMVTEKTTAAPDSTTQPSQPASATLEISATIDGVDIVTITADGLSWNHKSSGAPADVYVNGIPWNVQAGGSLPSSDALAFLRKADFSAARVLQKSGRGVVAMQPIDNGLEIDFGDSDPGADQYDIKISIPAKK
jgi:clan AA aspartic protease (TIGR02281 family)